MNQLPLCLNHVFLGPADTSRAAAERVEPVSGVLRQRVYLFIAVSGPQGITNAEIATGTDIKLQTVCPRTNELWHMGRIKDSRRRRGGGKVWVAT